MRNNVSLYDRQTMQTTLVGPDLTGFDRNVRTMPIAWSPADPHLLFYASDAVWKSADHGHSWTRISPDLARQRWEIPANAGQYASSVTAAPRGAITALALSPRRVTVLWAGTDDGSIQVTTDGGTTWTNVTPPAITPWTRIFNLDAGHFDTRTAYAAANTLRIDDLNPHFWRTHDGGKTWTEIDHGIAPGAVANSIREDPRQPGLLFASTDTQVWVSYDDGDQWESLRRNMPAISVRDLAVKDDSGCRCADLVAGTHGRGYWILDDITPFRQAAAARTATAAYLFKPEIASRVRFATNDPTPWPPELNSGENPPYGAIIDYYVSASAGGPITLEILDATGARIRWYSSEADTGRAPDPAEDPDEYTKICQRKPNAPNCALPLYWPGPAMALSTRAGMHRITWDLHYQPIPTEEEPKGEEEEARGAVPHRTVPTVDAPWAPAGAYSVRLTVAGRHYEQPLTLTLDPRVTTPAAGLVRLAALSRQMYNDALRGRAAYAEARTLATRLTETSGTDIAAFAARLDSLAPAAAPADDDRPRPRRGQGKPAPPTLASIADVSLGAAMVMQNADVTPTATQVVACQHAHAQSSALLARWAVMKTTGLAALNARRAAAGESRVQ
jgi:hypothetical protein